MRDEGIKENTMFYNFENLNVYKEALNLCIEIYKISNKFPKEELYGLTSQIKRAVVSISSNIAEGSSRNSLKEQMRFTEISYGSLMEVLSQISIAERLNYINKQQYDKIREKIETVSKLLSGLRNSQEKRIKTDER